MEIEALLAQVEEEVVFATPSNVESVNEVIHADIVTMLPVEEEATHTADHLAQLVVEEVSVTLSNVESVSEETPVDTVMMLQVVEEEVLITVEAEVVVPVMPFNVENALVETLAASLMRLMPALNAYIYWISMTSSY